MTSLKTRTDQRLPNRRFRNVLAAIMLIATAILVATIGAELITRFLGLSALYLTDPIFESSPYAGVVYEFKPNARGYTWGHTWTEINSQGFRGAEVPLTKPPHTYRVGVFGDSCTFGQGVDAHDTFSSVLERSLNDRFHDRDIRVEVLNFGVPSYSIANIVSTFSEKGTRFNLDVAILATIIQDYGFDRDHKADRYGYPVHAATPIQPGRMKNLLRHLHLSYVIRDTWWRLTAYRSAESSMADAVQDGSSLPPAVMQRAEQELSRFAEVARRAGVVPIYLTLSSVEAPELNAIADRNGFGRFAIGPVYAQYDATALSVSPRDPHPSGLAHSLIAGLILEPVVQVLEAKLPEAPHGAASSVPFRLAHALPDRRQVLVPAVQR